MFSNKENKKVAEFPIEAVTDNKSLHDAVHSTKTLEDKRLKVDICAVKLETCCRERSYIQ